MPLNYATAQPGSERKASVDIGQEADIATVRAQLHEKLDQLLDAVGLNEKNIDTLRDTQAHLILQAGVDVVFQARKKVIIPADIAKQASEMFGDLSLERQAAEEVLVCMLLEAQRIGKVLSVNDVRERTGYTEGTIQHVMIKVRSRCKSLRSLALLGSKTDGWHLLSTQPDTPPDPEAFVLPSIIKNGRCQPELRFSRRIGETVLHWKKEPYVASTRTEQAVASLLLDSMYSGTHGRSIRELCDTIGIDSPKTIWNAVQRLAAAGRTGKIPAHVFTDPMQPAPEALAECMVRCEMSDISTVSHESIGYFPPQ